MKNITPPPPSARCYFPCRRGVHRIPPRPNVIATMISPRPQHNNPQHVEHNSPKAVANQRQKVPGCVQEKVRPKRPRLQ